MPEDVGNRDIVATNPVFLVPATGEPASQKSFEDSPASPYLTNVSLSAHKDGDNLQITNMRDRLPEESSVTDRNALVKAVTQACNLNVDAAHAIARAVVFPKVAAQIAREGHLVEETAQTATLGALAGSGVYLHEVFPLLQPRSGGSPVTVPHPAVRGLVDDDGRPEAAVSLTFRDHTHLEDYLKQTVVETRNLGSRYDDSILSRRVGRPILVHVARLDFTDGSESVWVLLVRDGLTRVVSSWAARLNAQATADEIADSMVSELLAVKTSTRRTDTATQERARGRAQHAAQARARFSAGMAGAHPSEDAIRVGQTFTLPAQMFIGVTAGTIEGLPAEEVFDDAVRSVIGSIHVEFRGWDQAAEQVEVLDRAMRRAVHAGKLPPAVVELATGIRPPTDTGEVFGDPAIPGTPLWRAVYLIAELCSPQTYAALKREMRSLIGISSIRDRRFVGHLGPVIDLPWRMTKSHTLKTARRAWSAGGPIPSSVIRDAWTPTPTGDFTVLVPRALAGDTNARNTLMVAGGIALVTDKLLTSNVGSALTSGAVPFRADPDTIVAGLGTTEEGLWLLARAANAFDPDRKAVNSFTDTELAANPDLGAGAYVVPRVDPRNPSRMETDQAGMPKHLNVGQVVTVSDRHRAAEAIKDAKARAATDQPEKTDAERISEARRQMESAIAQATDRAKELGKLPHAYETADQQFEIMQALMQLQIAVGPLTVATAEEPTPDELEELDELEQAEDGDR